MIVLDADVIFMNFLPWCTRPVIITQPIAVIGLRSESDGDTFSPYALVTNVNMIEERDGSAIFQSSYYSMMVLLEVKS